MQKQKNIPQLRFPEFKGEWERKKLGDICEKIQDGNYGGDYPKATEFLKEGIPFLTSKTIGQDGNIMEEKIDYISIEKHQQLKKAHLKLHDVLFTNRGSNVGSIGLVNERIAHGNIGPQITLLRCTKEVHYLFLKEIMSSDVIQKQVNSQNSGSAMNFFGIGETSKFKIPIASFEEQKKIATFLTAIFEKAQALKQKKTLLEQYKKGVMQKIFSSAGKDAMHCVFTDDKGKVFPKWERKKLGDIFSFRVTNSYSRENLNYDNGEIKNIHYGDIHTKFQSHFDLSKEYVPFINSEVELKRIAEGNYCKEGDLIIADASEDYADVGKCIEIINLNGEKVLAGLHTILARPDKHKMSLGFSGHLMQSENIRLQIKTIAQGSKVLSISATRLSNINIDIPSEKEQTKIATFLSALDEKINHTENQIQQTEQYKKGLLQNMFC
jgi:type I restriction enzyme, S subunit